MHRYLWCFNTYIFDRLSRHRVNEICSGHVKNDGVNVPRPLAQRSERDPLQVTAQSVLTAGGQRGGVALLQVRQPAQTGGIRFSSFQVLPSTGAVQELRGRGDDKHRAVLSLGPDLRLVCVILTQAGVVPVCILLHGQHRYTGQLSSCALCSSLSQTKKNTDVTVWYTSTGLKYKHDKYFCVCDLSPGLPLGPSLCPPFPAFLFGLLPPLIDDHFTDVQSTLEILNKEDDVTMKQEKTRLKLWNETNLFLQCFEVKLSIGKIYCCTGAKNSNAWNLFGLTDREKSSSFHPCSRFAKKNKKILTSLWVSISKYSSVPGTFPRTEYVGLGVK